MLSDSTQAQQSTVALPQLVKPSWKRKRYAPRIYNKEKQAEYHKRFKDRYEVKIFECVDIGPLKNILSLKDKNGERWFVAAQLYREICGKRFRQDAKLPKLYDIELKLFNQLELPPMARSTIISPTGVERHLVYERHPSITKKTMLTNEKGVQSFVILYSKGEMKQFFQNLTSPLSNVIKCTNQCKNE